MNDNLLSNRIARLGPPPRWVPLPVVCSAMMGLVGGLGAFFFLFGMIFVWVFGGDLRPLDEWRLARSTTTTEATVAKVIATNAEENEVTVYEYRFTFRAPDERTVNARSYSRGRLWEPGETVMAWYVPDKPTVARLEGTRLSIFPLWALFVLIFPAIGAAFLLWSAISGLRQIMLLRYGEVAGARWISAEATNTTLNDQPVMKYTYEFRASDGMTYRGSSRALLTSRLGDETEEPVLYLPSNPARSMLVDALPLKYPLDVDDAGQWTAFESAWPVVWFGLAWLGVAAHVVYGLWRWVG